MSQVQMQEDFWNVVRWLHGEAKAEGLTIVKVLLTPASSAKLGFNTGKTTYVVDAALAGLKVMEALKPWGGDHEMLIVMEDEAGNTFHEPLDITKLVTRAPEPVTNTWPAKGSPLLN